MSERVRVSLDSSVTPEQVRDALVRVTGREVSLDGREAEDVRVVMFRIGTGVLESDRPTMVVSSDPDDLSGREVSVPACERSRATMRALARELGGRCGEDIEIAGAATGG